MTADILYKRGGMYFPCFVNTGGRVYDFIAKRQGEF